MLLAGASGHAAVVYDDSTPPTFTAGASLNRRIVASDFVLGTSAKVTDVHFWTAELSTFAYAGSTLEYYFYQGGTAPAAANLLTSGAAQNIQRTQVNSTANCGGVTCLGYFYEFDLEVADRFDATAGETYWLALYFRNGGASPAAYWSTSSAVVGEGDCSSSQAGSSLDASAVTFNCPTSKISYAYELTGTDVPEPASAALLLAGLAALGLGTARHRS